MSMHVSIPTCVHWICVMYGTDVRGLSHISATCIIIIGLSLAFGKKLYTSWFCYSMNMTVTCAIISLR